MDVTIHFLKLELFLISKSSSLGPDYKILEDWDFGFIVISTIFDRKLFLYIETKQ